MMPGSTFAAFPTSRAGLAALVGFLSLFIPFRALAQEPAPGQAAPAAALDRYALDQPTSEWRLPRRLREISGLAFAPDGRLFAHDDERAVIYQMNPPTQELVKAWSFGDPPARGDFEGIAVSPDRFWLVTSGGRLYEGPEGEDDERVLFNTYGTGVGRDCEVEGLVYEPSDETLLMLCKNALTAELAGFVAVYRWSIEERRVVGPRIRVRVSALTPPGEDEGFGASGIERDAATGNYILISASDERIAEITAAGRVVRAFQWSRRAHPQPEGVAIGPDGTLYVSDEGQGGRALLTTYAPRP